MKRFTSIRSLRSITISRACTRSQNLSKDASWRMAWHKVLFVTHSLSWKVIGFWMLDNIIWYATLDFMTFSIISLKKLTLGWLCLTLVPSLVVVSLQPELPEKQAAWPKASRLSWGSEGLFDQRHAVGLGCLVYVKSILVRFSNSVGSRGTILADFVSLSFLQVEVTLSRWSSS